MAACELVEDGGDVGLRVEIAQWCSGNPALQHPILPCFSGAVADVVGNRGGVVSGLFNEPWPALGAGGDHTIDEDSSKGRAEQALFAGETWFDPIGAGLRGRIRGQFEELVEQELEAALGRGRYERGGAAGHRHGHRTRRLTGSFGPVEIALPRARLRAEGGSTREWRSAVLPRYLILDGTVVRVRLDRKATSVSLLVVLGVRRDGQKVLLAARTMGGESEAAWRALLDDLVVRGLRAPEFLVTDGAAGLETARAALWPAVPAQRCTVHKHRNLLAHAPERLHREISADYTAAMLFWALLASGQISMRKVDGWQSLGQPPAKSAIDLAA
jgi:Transposase, Mutator family